MMMAVIVSGVLGSVGFLLFLVAMFMVNDNGRREIDRMRVEIGQMTVDGNRYDIVPRK